MNITQNATKRAASRIGRVPICRGKERRFVSQDNGGMASCRRASAAAVGCRGR
jgi:hypothetical protein